MDNQPVKIQDVFYETKLWKQFQVVAAQKNSLLVKELIDFAFPILDRIVETFPTYTIHNGQHQLNIIKLIENILGTRMADLTDLECAFLILSTFYHDIGMVFTKEEIQQLSEEDEFSTFLDRNSAAKLEYLLKGLTQDLAEWYCRWAHAKRVWNYLKVVENKLDWDGLNIKKELGEICVSHNEDIDYIKDDFFDIDFWGNADMKFCAILLRLADILDFDNTRSPESVFEFLKLESSRSGKQKVSYQEWSKHLASKGFSFKDWNQERPYELEFRATPNHPAVENDIQEFLNTIEIELQKCSTLIKFCSHKWSNFILPDSIKRNNIRSQGYKSGNFKFSLDQQQVLELLMGENLYESEYVFIRELLQNSIDTSRHRFFHEHKNGNKSYVPPDIHVSTWIDQNGYRWLRVDDYGMGMDENIIKKFFLKVGNSYYNSNEFKIKKLEYKQVEDVDFTPISRFGIGILSCFISGDEVHVNTRSVDVNGKGIFPIRLTLKGVHNFYVLQTDKDIPYVMPSEDEVEEDYRKTAGTSIAVRFKTSKDSINFDLEWILKANLFNPEVNVFLKNGGYTGFYPSLFNSQLCPRKTVLLSHEDKSQIGTLLSKQINSDIKLHLVPIDISQASPTEYLCGQLVTILVEVDSKDVFDNSENPHWFNDYPINFSLDFSSDYFNDKPQLLLRANNRRKEKNNAITIDVTNLLREIEFFKIEAKINHLHNGVILSHNGILINNKDQYYHHGLNVGLHISNKHRYAASQTFGFLSLKDKLRPELTVSRNKIVKLGWELTSQINYTIRKGIEMIEEFSDIHYETSFVSPSGHLGPLVYKEFAADPLINESFWPQEKIFWVDSGSYVSINDILKSDIEFEYSKSYTFGSGFSYLLKRTLLQKYCSVKILLRKNDSLGFTKVTSHMIIKKKSDLDVDVSLFPPLTFAVYQNFSGLFPSELGNQEMKCLNLRHPYSQWLIKAQYVLFDQFRVHFFHLIQMENFGLINEIIAKLRKVMPSEFKPHSNLILLKEDFEIDTSALF